MSGGGGGTTTSQQTVNTNMGPWQPQQQYLGDVFQNAKHWFDDTSNQNYFPTSTVAGMTSGQTQGLDKVVQMGLEGSPLMPAANRTALDTINGTYLDPSTNPYLKGTFDVAAGDITRAYQTATAPNTDAAFAAAGRYGGGAYRNMRESNELSLGKRLGETATTIYGDNYARERQNQLNQTNNVGSLIQASYLDPTAAINAAGALQQQNQAELTDEVNRWNYNRDRYWNNLARYKALIDGNYGQQGTTTSTGTMTQPQSSGNPMGQILGGALSAASVAGGLGWSPFSSMGAGVGMIGAGSTASLGSGLPLSALAFSDVRLKEDIAPIGKTNDGQNLYSYRYKGDPTPHVGLMAQEVERIKPEAVVTHPSGFKMVNYDLALLPSILAPRGV